MNGSLARFLLAAVLLIAAALFLWTHTRSEVFPSRLGLQSFPVHLGHWTGSDVAIDKETLQVLGAGDFLSRVYSDQEQPPHYIDLFIAYFPSQRAGDTIHSPKNCLPGAGWSPIQSTRINLDAPNHAAFPVNRYIIAKGDSKALVLYWYWAHDRGLASEYLAKYFLIADSIRMNRSDGSLVRVSTPVPNSETLESAEQRLLPFAGEIVPQLDSYIPR